MTLPTEITLANLGGGDLVEYARVELRKICENIADPNIKTDAIAEICKVVGTYDLGIPIIA